MVLIKDYKDLFTKIADRPRLDVFESIVDECGVEAHAACRIHPLSVVVKKREQFLRFLDAFYERNMISFFSYSASKCYGILYRCLRVFYLLLKNRYAVWRVENIPDNFSCEYITLTKGIDRSKSPFFDSHNVFDVPCCREHYRLPLQDALSVIILMYRFKSLDIWNVVQYLVFRNFFRKNQLSAKTLIIEEGGDFTGKVFCYFVKDHVDSITLTHMTPSVFKSFPCYGVDQIITSGSILKQALEKSNSSVKSMKSDFGVSREYITSYKGQKLGYFPDIGTYLLNLNHKKQYDDFIVNFSEEQNISVYITVHPQDRKLRYNYSREIFCGDNFTIRHKEDLNEYFVEVDILVGWWSSLIFQGLYCGKPVILLDFFGDNQGEAYEKASNGLIRRAKSPQEFRHHYKELAELSSSDRDMLFEKNLYHLLDI